MSKSKIQISVFLFCLILLMPRVVGAQTKNPVDEALKKLEENKAAIAAKQAEIEELEKKIQALQGQRDTTAAEAEIIDGQVRRLTAQLTRAELELKQTQLNIQTVRQQQKQTEESIEAEQEQLERTREQLKNIIQLLHQEEQTSLVRIFLSSLSLSAVLAQREAYQELQQRAIESVQQLHEQEEVLKQQRIDLGESEKNLRQLHDVLAVQEEELAVARAEQKKFLAAKRAEQLIFEHEIAEAAAARNEIAQQVFTLKGAGVELSLNQALDMARLAGKLTGVRPALLLGVLKVESNVGERVGGGHYPDDMHPASREAFVRITKKLGLDPGRAPISARPRSYQGWGGAMGPGQIMPDTWERIEGRVGSLMGKALPNPYELTDAFVATALFLADKGAANPAQEYEAVNRYLAGPNWQRFTWYGDRVLAVAKEYATQL